jgi:pimeloyl-ACP methyl ester carboxylesterase
VAAIAACAYVLWPTPSSVGVGHWLAVDALTPRYETIDGLRVRYVRKGHGPPVVLLHGLASSIYTWKDVLPALATRHDVVALDLPGFGDSAVPERFNSEQAMRAVVALMDRLGIARASLVGNSLGGAIAVVIAARTPERVDRLVLVDAAGYNFRPADRPWILRLVAALPAGVADAMPRRPMVTLALRQVFHDRRLLTAERVAEYVAPLRRPGASRVVRQILLSEDAMGFPEIVRSVHAPTLVVWGRYDAWVSPRDAERFASDIPGARVVLLESGHMPQEERPTETAALIDDFLAATPGTRMAGASNPSEGRDELPRWAAARVTDSRMRLAPLRGR